jgi:hypothetical protein
MAEVLGLLRQCGATVDVIYPDADCTALDGVGVAHDLYILKSQSELALGIAGALHAVGAPILNPWPVAIMMRDKIAAMRRLLACGVPVPDTTPSPASVAIRCASSARRTASSVRRGSRPTPGCGPSGSRSAAR